MTDDRGLANGIMIFGVVLVTISILVIVMNPFMAPIEDAVMDQCAQSPGPSQEPCETGMSWVSDFWTWFAFVGFWIAFIGLIRQASVESRRGGGFA